MTTKFYTEKQEIRYLNEVKWKDFLEREFGSSYYLKLLANPDSFVENVFYHEANSEEEKELILKNGFDFNRVRKNSGVGIGLYLGRDKDALLGFYDPNWSRADHLLKVLGDFKFYDGINKPIPKNPCDVLELGFDGIRYYDPYATGEEFVLFKISKAKIETYSKNNVLDVAVAGI